jgi:apolipoprotein N-acyltransferase
LVINSGDATIPYIATEYGRIGTAICSDLDQHRYMSQAGKNQIDIMLVPAFDWEQITPYHSNMAAFAAIQFGVSVVRSNGKGIVAFYDYQGHALAKMNTLLSDTKINYAEVSVKSTTTVYSIAGDILVYIVTLFLLLVLVFKLAEKRNR